MRVTVMLCLLIGLAGCDASPASLGITGPAPPPPVTTPDDSTIGIPGVPDTTGYGPSVAPSTGSGRYFNYN